jgi:hypothetical protein
LALGILKKTTEMVTDTSRPIGRKVSLAERKIILRIDRDKRLLNIMRRR